MNIFLQLQVVETVRRSSRNGHYVPHIINDAKDPVIFYEWKSYLQEFLKPLKDITDYHHLFIDSKHPGVVRCKESVSYEQFTFNLLKFKTSLPQPQTHPKVSIIKGFDPARQWYLYDHIRQRCYSEEAKERTCLGLNQLFQRRKYTLQIKKKKMSTDQKGEGKRPF
jgi:hypothetical protein